MGTVTSKVTRYKYTNVTNATNDVVTCHLMWNTGFLVTNFNKATVKRTAGLVGGKNYYRYHK